MRLKHGLKIKLGLRVEITNEGAKCMMVMTCVESQR